MRDLVENIKQSTSYLFTDSGFVLVELRAFRKNRKVNLRFLVDRSTGGITLNECAQLNSQIGEIIDRKQLLEESYILEVSSPGADRPLVSLDDFSRSIGRNVRLFLREPINNKTELTGSIKGIEAEEVIFLVESECIRVPIDNIAKAKQTL
jgi:ribosome maturation factor RimP